MKPFLKWAGNKYRILHRIQQLLPRGQRLIEPFAGSAAVFLNTTFPQYVLNDANADLMNVYQTLKQYGRVYIQACQSLFKPEHNVAEVYYAYREEFNSTSDSFRKAVLFVYLNRHGYNGLCRYNKDGRFNVPFGRYRNPYFPLEEMLAFHRKAQFADLRCEDFETVMLQARPGDVVYCDPPYVPLSNTANFTSYHASGFGLEQQQRLAQLARTLAEHGIPVLISNHYNEFTRVTYASAAITAFHVPRFISCNGAKRQPAPELLALFDVPAYMQTAVLS
ncbi:Dam family site-specific DNA-(adenine-N6)-methyltransferase [Alicyclobacillus cycloheptanicus]|uniref:Site-specific DNA-methyltransferase (adenine-specific) n=1 Tax=Alicyclobacillus cycloheptanicus TaxID=1457 RepID=A0ABT9XJM5_9BACL|nr:Dam family site-specific DNA-(adenine-N6)-methyltransferase [Alicyclobacillus cycloheptanicus]MDQ0190325.1 DNA adenine methylase [Alicyclobacillus cycloheptanicus]WDM00030.1 Dam family site-specific DNA-(adenine-N6)-methyltransferase [Alicyclobacillus cycloheptanicus]